MTDLLDIIPDFPSEKYSHLIDGLEINLITTTDLLTLDALELARRAHLPILDLKAFVKDVVSHLHRPYEQVRTTETTPTSYHDRSAVTRLYQTGVDLVTEKPFISTLDDLLDIALGGGVAPGYVTEVTGESGAGKTQFLLTLLLSVQLSSPKGLGRGAIYISTEHALPTQRLQALLETHPQLKDCTDPPSLKNILSIQIPDLETQDHILTYQLPVVVKSKNIGLVVIDSIAANYRAEAESGKSADATRSQAKALAARSIGLIRTGALLRQIARDNDCAVVVANQVADRFDQGVYSGPPNGRTLPPPQQIGQSLGNPQADQVNNLTALSVSAPHSSPIALSQLSSPPHPLSGNPSDYNRPSSPSLHDPRLALDHQMRFFTGWGDSDTYFQQNLKTPALGLTWTNQIACRIAIIRESAGVGIANEIQDHIDKLKTSDMPLPETNLYGADWSKRRWRRWMRVVFSAWAKEVEEGDQGVEFEVWTGGIRAVTKS